MLLLQSDTGDATILTEMITVAKKRYVLNRHPYAITAIATGKKAGKFKTYVGKPRKEVIRTTEEELFYYLSEYYLDLEDKQQTFGVIFDCMLSELVEENNRSHNTVNSYKQSLTSFLPEEFFDKPITDITESELKTLIVRQTKLLCPRPEHLRKAIQLINRVFTYSLRNHICQVNPAQYIDSKNYLSNCSTKKKRAEEKEFSDDEIARIKANMLSTPDNPRALMVLLAIQTGMRRSEICALHWSDIENGYIHIHRQQLLNSETKPHRYDEVGYTKDEREHPHDGRKFPINAEIQQVLDLAKQLKGSSDYIFHDGDSWILRDGYTHFLARRCKSLGINTTNNHAFRVSLNNRLIRLGLSADDRALLLGHSVEVNERFYSKYDSRRIDTIAAILR